MGYSRMAMPLSTECEDSLNGWMLIWVIFTIISTQLNTHGRFWTDVLNSAYHHLQNTNWGRHCSLNMSSICTYKDLFPYVLLLLKVIMPTLGDAPHRFKNPKLECEVAVLTWVWCSAVTDNLSEQNTEGPDVWFDGKGAIVNSLRSSPLNGEFGTLHRKIARSVVRIYIVILYLV